MSSVCCELDIGVARKCGEKETETAAPFVGVLEHRNVDGTISGNTKEFLQTLLYNSYQLR